jgi:hypothetical protein
MSIIVSIKDNPRKETVTLPQPSVAAPNFMYNTIRIKTALTNFVKINYTVFEEGKKKKP